MGLVKDGKEVQGLALAGDTFSKVKFDNSKNQVVIGNNTYSLGVPTLRSYIFNGNSLSIGYTGNVYYVKVPYTQFQKDYLNGKTINFEMFYKDQFFVSRPFVFPADYNHMTPMVSNDPNFLFFDFTDGIAIWTPSEFSIDASNRLQADNNLHLVINELASDMPLVIKS